MPSGAKKTLAVLYLDVDRFKLFNDSYGHAIGDTLVQIIAERIKGCLRAEDPLARFGGDEFTVRLPQIRKKEDAGGVAKKMSAPSPQGTGRAYPAGGFVAVINGRYKSGRQTG